MSVAEILDELPKLDSVEFQLVFQRVLEIHGEGAFVASPELSKAIDEALAEPDENSVHLDEARRQMKLWNSA